MPLGVLGQAPAADTYLWIVRFAHPFSGAYPVARRGKTAKRRCLWIMRTKDESAEAGNLPRLNSLSIEYMVEHKQGEADGV